MFGTQAYNKYAYDLVLLLLYAQCDIPYTEKVFGSTNFRQLKQLILNVANFTPFFLYTCVCCYNGEIKVAKTKMLIGNKPKSVKFILAKFNVSRVCIDSYQ